MAGPDDERAADGTALVVIDLFSDWDFPDGPVLRAAAATIAPRIARLRRRCHDAGVPTIFANDNRGRWRSDFREQLAGARAAGAESAGIVQALAPDPHDWFVLKPRHSCFHATPMALLLEHLAVRRLILTGVSADQCVLYSAVDAKMLGFEPVVPRDCLAAPTTARTAAALVHLDAVLGIDTDEASTLALPDPRAPAADPALDG